MSHLGEAIHDVYAADVRDAPDGERVRRASAILARWGVQGLSAEEVVSSCDRLDRHLGSAFPHAVIKRETPVSARVGEQIVSGRMDLLIDAPPGFAIVDHKSFPGAADR